VLQCACSLCDVWGGTVWGGAVWGGTVWGGTVRKKMLFPLHVVGWDCQIGLTIFKINWCLLNGPSHVMQSFRYPRNSLSFDQCAGLALSIEAVRAPDKM
jgi:hypothetical protein